MTKEGPGEARSSFPLTLDTMSREAEAVAPAEARTDELAGAMSAAQVKDEPAREEHDDDENDDEPEDVAAGDSEKKKKKKKKNKKK